MFGDPTPEEIKAACAEIRKGWDEREERIRRVTKNRPVTISEVRIYTEDSVTMLEYER